MLLKTVMLENTAKNNRKIEAIGDTPVAIVTNSFYFSVIFGGIR